MNNYFLEETTVPENFIGWRVLGSLDNLRINDIWGQPKVWIALPEGWINSFRVAVKSSLILVDPDCPEVYFVDTENTLLNAIKEITKNDALDFDKITTIFAENPIFTPNKSTYTYDPSWSWSPANVSYYNTSINNAVTTISTI